jgi:hypothetical protein
VQLLQGDRGHRFAVTGPSTTKAVAIGADLAGNGMQVRGVDAAGRVVTGLLRRKDLKSRLSLPTHRLVGMKA